MSRMSKENYYLDIAQTVAGRSTCLRRHFGAIIVKNDVIVSTGYNGSPRGRMNCTDIGVCLREKMQIPRGERYELCRAVHAEANAIIAASRDESMDSTLYLACVDPVSGELIGNTSSCAMCRRLIINAGIRQVIIRDSADSFTVTQVKDWIVNDDTMPSQLGY